GFALFKQARLWAFSAAVLLPALLWYWHAYRISKLYYPYHFFGAGGIQVMSLAYYGKILIQIATSSLTPLLFGLAVIGLLLTFRNESAGIFRWWLGATILFIIVAGHGNRHQWYHLALVPIAAAFAGATLDLLARK